MPVSITPSAFGRSGNRPTPRQFEKSVSAILRKRHRGSNLQKILARDEPNHTAVLGIGYQLRRFLAFSEGTAAAVGLPAQQHQALLAIAGHASSDRPTIGILAEQLLIAPHTAGELTTRMVEAELLIKTVSTHDRRRIELSLTPKAQKLLGELTSAHLKELRTLEPALVRALGGLGAANPAKATSK